MAAKPRPTAPAPHAAQGWPAVTAAGGAGIRPAPGPSPAPAPRAAAARRGPSAEPSRQVRSGFGEAPAEGCDTRPPSPAPPGGAPAAPARRPLKPPGKRSAAAAGVVPARASPLRPCRSSGAPRSVSAPAPVLPEAGAGAPLRAGSRGGRVAARTGPGGASPPSPHCRGHLGSFRPGFGCVRAAMGKGEGAREGSGPRRSFRDGGRRCRSPGAAGAVQCPSRGPAGREVSAGRARPALLRAGTRLPGQASGRRGDGTGFGGWYPMARGEGRRCAAVVAAAGGRAEEKAGTAGRPPPRGEGSPGERGAPRRGRAPRSEPWEPSVRGQAVMETRPLGPGASRGVREAAGRGWAVRRDGSRPLFVSLQGVCASPSLSPRPRLSRPRLSRPTRRDLSSPGGSRAASGRAASAVLVERSRRPARQEHGDWRLPQRRG